MLFQRKSYNHIITIVLGVLFSISSIEAQDSDLSISDVAMDDSIASVTQMIRPNIYLLPPIFDGKFADDISVPIPSIFFENKEFTIFPSVSLKKESEAKVEEIRRKAYRNFLINNIESVKYTGKYFEEKEIPIESVKPNVFKEIFVVEKEPVFADVEVLEHLIQRNHWRVTGNHLLQFSQNYISNNWYAGGVGNFNLLSKQDLSIEYRKNRIQFNNFIEWKLSFYTNPSNNDSRDLKIGEDLFRIYSDFGVQAYKNRWSYSVNMEFKTQFFKNYDEETDELVTSLFSPITLNTGLGMKYQFEKKDKTSKYKKTKFSADISPLSIQYSYISDSKINVERYGFDLGDSYLLDFGSSLNAKLTMGFNRQVNFSSRLKFFTNYHKTIVEFENELNLALSRFFSTRLYLYARFDDTQGITKDSGLGYFQMNELISFGFNYKWD